MRSRKWECMSLSWASGARRPGGGRAGKHEPGEGQCMQTRRPVRGKRESGGEQEGGPANANQGRASAHKPGGQ